MVRDTRLDFLRLVEEQKPGLWRFLSTMSIQKESRLGRRLRRLRTLLRGRMMPSDGHTCYSCSICKIKRRRERERVRERVCVREREREACAAISYNACSGWENTRDTIPFLVF